MTTTIDIRELPASLEEALALAASGGEVILPDGEAPRAGSAHAKERLLASRPPRRCDPAGPGLRRTVAG